MDNDSSASWSSLPSDLLSAIAARLETRVDILRFRAICHSWRSSIPLSLSSPPSLKLPFPIAPNPYLNPNRHGHFSLKETPIYAFDPLCPISPNNLPASHSTWLTRFEPLDSGRFALRNPLFRFKFNNLARKLSLNTVNLLHFNVVEVSKVYELEFVGDNADIEFNEMKSIMIKRVVVSSRIGNETDAGFVVLALHTGGQLGVWKIGEKKWVHIKDNRERPHYEDVIFHNGYFYALDFSGFTLKIDPATLKGVQVAPAAFLGYSGCQSKHLVSSFGDLVRVDKYLGNEEEDLLYCYDDEDEYMDELFKPNQLVLYKLDKRVGNWVPLYDLGAQSLFIGDLASFSLLAQDFHGIHTNCVYLDDTSFAEDDDDHPGCFAALYNLKNNRVVPLFKLPSSSNIFWPPPAWLKSQGQLSEGM